MSYSAGILVMGVWEAVVNWDSFETECVGARQACGMWAVIMLDGSSVIE